MTLQRTLERLILAGERSRQVQEIHLQRGLIVSIMVTPQMTQLRLWRTTVRPSLAEWRTVINAWPYRVRLAEPADVAERGMLGLSGSWPTPSFPATQLSLAESEEIIP